MKKLHKGLISSGVIIGLGIGCGIALADSEASGSNSMTLSVNCTDGGPNVAAAGGLNDPQEMYITLETPQGHINMTAKLGEYSIDGVRRQHYRAGTILANLGSAQVIAGAPNTDANNFYQADQSITLLCNGVQPKNVSSGY